MLHTCSAAYTALRHRGHTGVPPNGCMYVNLVAASDVDDEHVSLEDLCLMYLPG